MNQNEIAVGDDTNLVFMLGDMGVQEIYVGDDLYYKRNASYCYIEFAETNT